MERNMDESRKAFEQWYLLSWGCREDNHETLFEIGPDDGIYYRLGVRLAYDAWQASREAIEIELPSHDNNLDDELSCFDGEYDWGNRAGIVYGINQCANVLRAAGIKVKE